MPGRTHQLYHLYVYPNEECNLACRHCWITAKLAPAVTSRKLNSDVYRRIVDELIPLGLALIAISGGEPLMSRDETLSLISYAGKHNVATRIETNGTLIDEEAAKIFKEARTQVSVSLDGSTPEVHERMRVIPGCYERTMRAFSILKQFDVPVEIIMSVWWENVADLANVAKIAAELPNGRVKINPVQAMGRGKKMEQKGQCMNATELFHWIRTLEQERDKYAAPLLITAEPAFRSLHDVQRGLASGDRCSFLNLLGILANGDVSFCGMGYKVPDYIFGNAIDTPIPAIWNQNPTLEEIRTKIPGQLEGICSNCVMKWTCQGACRANAYETFGSITAPSRGCQDLYEQGTFPKSRMIDPAKVCDYEPSAASLPVLN